jgi:cobalt-zinc-cadmium efflux system membrane fusion protein
MIRTSNRIPALYLSAPLALMLCFNPMPVTAEEAKPIDATPALLKLLKIEAVKPSMVVDSLEVPAKVELNQQRIARIGASVTGRVSEITAMLGQTVKKGEHLALLNSTELSIAQSDYLKASSQVNLRRLAVQRAQRLLESDAIAAAELLDRQGILTEAEVDLQAAQDRLRVMGMTENDLNRLAKKRSIHSFSPVVSNIDGVVIERNITLGQVVQPSDALYTVADLSQVWLAAEVPEQQAHWAHAGDEADAEIPALPEKNVHGKLVYVADMVNPETRTVMVRMEVPNPKRDLKPQMLATLLIYKHGVQSLTLPDKAVFRDENRDYVFVETQPNRFQMRPVQLGEAEAHVRPVISGLKAGERVVVDGAFHLNNERMRSALE